MSLFRQKPDPFSSELKKLEQEARLVEEKLKKLQHQLGQPQLPIVAPAPPALDSFKGATFRDSDTSTPKVYKQSSSLKIQRRKIRNRVIVLGVVLLVLILMILKTLN